MELMEFFASKASKLERKEIKRMMGLMRPRGLSRPRGLIALIALIALMGLMGCSEEQEKSLGRMTVEGVPFAPMFVEEGERGTTRSGETPDPTTWTPPSPYVTYDNINGKFKQQKDLMNKSINIFFTQDDKAPMEGIFFYRPTDKTWQLNMDIETSGTYYLYGYIPKEDAEGVTISPNEAYSDGAVLTINGLNAVTHSDVCVIIGAKNGGNVNDDNTGTDESPEGLQAGQFAVDVLRVVKDEPSGSNFIFLLFDHIYSALRFRFSVNEEYAALRTIKLRKLELTPYQDDQKTGVKAKFNATIQLQKNDDNISPIVEDIVFTPVESETEPEASALDVPIFDGEVELPTYPELPEEFLGCFVPGCKYFKLRCTYDVYDNDNNLIRQGCEAENDFDLDSKFGNEAHVMRGHCYSYSITVQPTYLYVLSEPDMDNPTVTIQ